MPTINKDMIIAALTFVAGVLALLASQPFVTAQYVQYIVFAVGVVNLALSIFFGVQRPIYKAFGSGREAAIAEFNAKK